MYAVCMATAHMTSRGLRAYVHNMYGRCKQALRQLKKQCPSTKKQNACEFPSSHWPIAARQARCGSAPHSVHDSDMWLAIAPAMCGVKCSRVGRVNAGGSALRRRWLGISCPLRDSRHCLLGTVARYYMHCTMDRLTYRD